MKRPSKLQSERLRLKRQIAELQKSVGDLESEVSLRWEIRAIHGDIDSIKHMVRGIQQKIGIVASDTLDQYVNPNVSAILTDIRGQYAERSRPAPVRKKRKPRRHK